MSFNPVTYVWESNKELRIPTVVSALKNAGRLEGWTLATNTGSIIELAANHIGGKQKEKSRKAFKAYLDGDLDNLKLDSGKSVSAAFMFGVMLGRMPNKNGKVPSIGNKLNGIYTKPADFERNNPMLYRLLERKGGVFQPCKASTTVTRNIERVSVEETARLIVADAEAMALTENGKRSLSTRSIAFASLANSNANSATMLLPAPTEPVESAKDKKNRKARERRAALKASKSSK